MVSALLVVAAISGCTASNASTADSQATTNSVGADREVPVVVSQPDISLPATVTDATGNTVTVTDTSRIIALSGGIAETLVAIGMRDQIVGRDVSTDFPGISDVALVTNGHDLSAEGTLALNPTLILADTRSGPPEALDSLRNSGVPVVVVPEVWTLGESAARTSAIAAAVGAPSAGVALNAYIAEASTPDTSIPADNATANKPTVAFLYVRGTAAVYLLGGDGSGADDLIEAAGGIDAGTKANLTGFTPLTPEALAASAPDVILVMNKGLESVGDIAGLVALPGVSQTPAGRNQRVVSLPDGELLNFGPRTPATIAALREQLS